MASLPLLLSPHILLRRLLYPWSSPIQALPAILSPRRHHPTPQLRHDTSPHHPVLRSRPRHNAPNTIRRESNARFRLLLPSFCISPEPCTGVAEFVRV